MRNFWKFFCLMAFASVLLLTGVQRASAATYESGVDWSNSVITVEGTGVAPMTARNPVQMRMLARRAAVVDAYRQIAEQVRGVQVDAETTVENMMVASDIVRTKVSALVQGARIIEEHAIDGGYVVRMQVGMYGVSNSLASAVFERPSYREPFPSPVPGIAPAPVTTTTTTTTTTTSSQVDASLHGEPLTGSASSHKGSSATEAPYGKAVGIYTGLIVDCRGLGLKPVMSPVLKNELGSPIYGYKNLNYDAIVKNGMASYTTDINFAARAGSQPLVVRAISLDGANPVLSTADANRVLIENGATGFLDKTNVVLVR